MVILEPISTQDTNTNSNFSSTQTPPTKIPIIPLHFTIFTPIYYPQGPQPILILPSHPSYFYPTPTPTPTPTPIYPQQPPPPQPEENTYPADNITDPWYPIIRGPRSARCGHRRNTKVSGSGSVSRKVRNGNVDDGKVKKLWKQKGYNGNFSEGKKGKESPKAKGNNVGELGNCTTVMLKNVPNSLSRGLLKKMLDTHCRQQNQKHYNSNVSCPSQYDFLYLPIDFVRKNNLGYAFINFTTKRGASNFYTCWNDKPWDDSPKVSAVTPAKLQGLAQCKRHFQQSLFVCQSALYLPVEFCPPRNGFNDYLCETKTIGKWICSDEKSDRSLKNGRSTKKSGF